MAEEHKVTLHGTWSSPYSKRVELALKFKGISYELVEEDLANKSSLLLKYNPVHKKVPVLVHNGNPILESLLILEYIDEVWSHSPRFLPDDPCKRAKVRFWVHFFQQHVFETLGSVLTTDGETQEKAIKEYYEKIGVFEQGVKELFNNGAPFDGEDVGLLDVLLVATFGVYKGQEEVLGIKVIEPEKCPVIFSRLTSLIEHPVVKDSLPAYEVQVQLVRGFRASHLK